MFTPYSVGKVSSYAMITQFEDLNFLKCLGWTLGYFESNLVQKGHLKGKFIDFLTHSLLLL